MKLGLITVTLFLAACGTPSSYPPSSAPAQSLPPASSLKVGSGDSARQGISLYTISGRIVHQDTGAPYVKAWVRFGWLVNAVDEREADTKTGSDGRYVIRLPAGMYRVSAGDECDLDAGFDIVGRSAADGMIVVPEATGVDFVGHPITGTPVEGMC
jgi:hypothetical protein